MSSIKASDIVDRVGMLPPLPDTALKLMKTLNDPQSTVDQIVEVIKYDQAVTSEVLRLCNSAFLGVSRKVTSLNEAMLCLGTVKVLQLVMSVHTNSLLSREQQGYGLPPGMLWTHSVAVALASSALAQKIKMESVSLVFTAGLLHDIGKVVLNTFVAEEFAQIVRCVTEKKASFAEAEHEILGFSHEEIGELIAQKWQLPEPIIKCIRHHHDAGTVEPPDTLVDVVYVANCLCLLLGLGLGEDGLQYRADSVVMERNNLTEHDLEVIGAQTLVDLKKVEDLFADSARTHACPEMAGKDGV